MTTKFGTTSPIARLSYDLIVLTSTGSMNLLRVNEDYIAVVGAKRLWSRS
jgi:hypothetical protein